MLAWAVPQELVWRSPPVQRVSGPQSQDERRKAAQSFGEARRRCTLPVERLDDVAESVIRGGMKLAAAEGAGFGLGGILTIVPDLGILSAITMRTIQKLSLIYGFELNTDDEIAELWIAAASAAGVDISRELLEKEVINRFVPKVIQRIAVEAGADVVEKWAGRLLPVVSSAIGCALNYYFVRAWGQRARAHFRAKHLETRRRFAEEQMRLPGAASGSAALPS